MAVSRIEGFTKWFGEHKKTGAAAVVAVALAGIGMAIHFGDLNNNILNSITSHAMEYAIAGSGALLLVVLTSAFICYVDKKVTAASSAPRNEPRPPRK